MAKRTARGGIRRCRGGSTAPTAHHRELRFAPHGTRRGRKSVLGCLRDCLTLPRSRTKWAKWAAPAPADRQLALLSDDFKFVLRIGCLDPRRFPRQCPAFRIPSAAGRPRPCLYTARLSQTDRRPRSPASGRAGERELDPSASSFNGKPRALFVPVRTQLTRAHYPRFAVSLTGSFE